MAKLNDIIEKTLLWEGGYSNNPNDPGGETNYGITKSVAMDFGYMDDMKIIPMTVVESIYEQKYFEPMKLDFITDNDIASQIFQAAVNQGVPLWKKFIQMACNYCIECLPAPLVIDGEIGTQTITAINNIVSAGKKSELSKAIYDQQVKRYNDIIINNPKLAWAQAGWQHRAKAFLWTT